LPKKNSRKNHGGSGSPSPSTSRGLTKQGILQNYVVVNYLLYGKFSDSCERGEQKIEFIIMRKDKASNVSSDAKIRGFLQSVEEEV